jgi:hypothetical protein
MVGLVVVKQNDVLTIRVDYPSFGISFSDLTLQVELPAGYRGTVKVTTVSGAIDLPAQRGQDWDALDLKSFPDRSGRPTRRTPASPSARYPARLASAG